MNEVHRARPLLGTIAQITVRAARDRAELHAAVDAAFAQIGLVQSLMSWHDAHSELSCLNRLACGSEQPVHPHTRAVLAAALEVARLSGGAFDPCIAATLARWGLLPCPAQAAVPEAGASWRDIELTAQGVRFHRPLWLDLGGIAKGYAVDLAVQCLVQQGIEDLVVNAGGDLRVVGPPARRVGLRHPQHAHALAHELELTNEALATSSSFGSRRWTADGEVCALVSPARGAPYAGPDSISVMAPTCMVADALTKVALFAASPVAEAVFETFQARCVRLAPVSTH